MSHHSDLIDTTEMYLRTVYELEEEGVTALRARIAERLGQSGPTVSQTVARMDRDGLLHVGGDRHLVLTEEGRRQAIRVMRKHRLAERLLIDVIGLDWEDVHVEACRWEHVMSEAVERRIVAMLRPPLVCPHGNPIPGLAELGVPDSAPAAGSVAWGQSVEPAADRPPEQLVPLGAAVSDQPVVIERISEQVQSDIELLHRLRSAGIGPGVAVVATSTGDGISITTGDPDHAAIVLDAHASDHIFVRLQPVGVARSGR